MPASKSCKFSSQRGMVCGEAAARETFESMEAFSTTTSSSNKCSDIPINPTHTFEFSNIAMWLDAASLSGKYSNSKSIPIGETWLSVLPNKPSGTFRSFGGTTPFTYNCAALNSRPAVNFNPSAGHYIEFPAGFENWAGCAIFAVYRESNSGALMGGGSIDDGQFPKLLSLGNGGGFKGMIEFNIKWRGGYNGMLQIGMDNGLPSAGITKLDDKFIVQNKFDIYGWNTGSTSSDTWTAYNQSDAFEAVQHGAQDIRDQNPRGWPETKLLRSQNYIGRSNWTERDGFMGGDLCEIIVFNAGLSQAEADNVMTYLYQKYFMQMDLPRSAPVDWLSEGYSPYIRELIDAAPTDTVLQNPATLESALSLDSVISLRTNEENIAAHFEGASSSSSTSNTMKTNLADVADKMAKNDQFTWVPDRPATTEMLMGMMFLFCKRVAIQHIECRIGGSINGSTSTNTTGTTICGKKFPVDVLKACEAHLTAIGQLLRSRVPFENDRGDIKAHLTLCNELITSYVRGAVASSTQSLSGDAAGYISSPALTTQIFGPAVAPTVTPIIYHCFLPWLKLLFVESYIGRERHDESLMWIGDAFAAYYIIHLAGYFLADRLDSASGSRGFGRNGDVFDNVMAAIVTSMSSTAQSEMQSQLVGYMNYLARAVSTRMSADLTDTDASLKFRRQNVESMGDAYNSAVSQATKMQRAFYATLGVLAGLTLLVAGLVVFNNPGLAVLTSGLFMLGIMIYVSSDIVFKGV